MSDKDGLERSLADGELLRMAEEAVDLEGRRKRWRSCAD